MTERLTVFLSWLKSTTSIVALKAAAYDDPKLAAECSITERNSAIVRGAVLVGFSTFNAALYAAVASYLAGGFSMPLGIACISVSVLLGLGDHYSLYRTALYTDGLHSLRDGGMRTDFLAAVPPYSRLAKRARIALSLVLSTATAIGIGLILNNTAIDRRIEQEYLSANKAIVDRANRDFEQGLKRKEAAYNAKGTEIERLSAGRTDEVRAAIREARAARHDTIIATRDAAEAFEKKMATQQARLNSLKDELDHTAATRQETIHRAIEASPERIPRNTTFVRRIKAVYYEEVADNPWTLLPVSLIDLAIILIDLSVLTLKAIYQPSAYAAAATRNALEALVAQARLGTANIGGNRGAPEAERPDEDPPRPPAAPAAQLRRKRGRPRKNGFDVTAVGTPHRQARAGEDTDA